MTWFLLIGDLVVMAFLTVVAIWVCAPSNRDKLEAAARVPLDEEESEPGHG